MTYTFTPMLHRYVGFEKLFEQLQTMTDATSIDKFPPHNISRINDNQYLIEMAIAGFSQDEIDVVVTENVLTIKGQKKPAVDSGEYLYRGIGTRSFTKNFQLADTIEVCGSQYRDGILRIGLENIIPESKKPRRIDVGTKEITFSKPQLLTE